MLDRYVSARTFVQATQIQNLDRYVSPRTFVQATQKKKEFLNTNNSNIRLPEAQKNRHKKTARRHCLMLSGTQLITAQLLSSLSAIMHAMRRDIGMKLHQYQAKNISFYNTSVLKFAMFCSFHNNCSKIFYFYRLFFDEFVMEITKNFLCYRSRVAWNR